MVGVWQAGGPYTRWGLGDAERTSVTFAMLILGVSDGSLSGV